MVSEYKLTYFPVKALAEPIRFLLSYAKLKFEDVRVSKDVWPEIKNQLPFGQVPVLEVDGKLAHQSVAIARYIAKQVDLVGKTDWENLEIDAMVDTITDLRTKIVTYNKENDETIKAALKTVIEDEHLPYYLTRFESTAKENNGHLALGRLTWADLYFISTLDYCNGVLKTDIVENYPNLVILKNEVLSLPGIEEWVQNRPESEY